MTNFPNNFDDDTTLPPINDNISQEGGYAINALRAAVFALEQNQGLGAAGTTGSIAARFGVSINPDGTLNPSALASLALTPDGQSALNTLQFSNINIVPNAGIDESKLLLDYRTRDLFNYIRDLSKDVNLVDGWIAITGIKLEPHLLGLIYRHTLDQIDVTTDLAHFPYLDNKFRVPRDNSQSYNLVNDINNEFLYHQWADGYSDGYAVQNVVTNGGSFYPSNYAHFAGGIFINTSRFQTIPQTASDLQSLADFIDNSSILLLGTRIQNLYANGISRNSRSSSLLTDGYGQPVVPVTPATAYLRGMGNSSSPVDNINNGDDIIQFFPTNNSSNLFDEQFAQVRVGDLVRINYGSIEVQFVILEKKYIQSGGNKTFIVRIAGKNLQYSTTAMARIDRPLFNNNKYGVLSTSGVNGRPGDYPASLIVATSRGAQALGVGFSPDEFNETHYLLYLALYPDGTPGDGYVILPGIDVTGNAGTTPGSYTLSSIVAATNVALRAPGFNYRFVAFEYQGNFGIMLADSYNNTSFSIMSGVVDNNGFYSQFATQLEFPNNVIDLFPTVAQSAPDPLGMGPAGANVASPPYQGTYSSPEQAIVPTQVFVPLKRNNYYVDGVERERMSIDVGQILDIYGDGYWFGTIDGYTIIPGPNGHVETTYVIGLDLSTSQLKAGKTLVVQSLSEGGTFVDFGRFIIQDVTFASCAPFTTSITVYDSVHGQGFSPAPTATSGTVALYFNSDSVTFDAESATDFNNVLPFRRHFEVYVDENGVTYTHERGRMFLGAGTGSPTSVAVDDGLLYCSSTLANFDLVRISPKLRGYQTGAINKIAFYINNYDSSSGNYDGYLGFYNGFTLTNTGPLTFGKRGEVTRFYDDSNVDFIDLNLGLSPAFNAITSFTDQIVDIQLFPTLSLDQEVMLISTCQLNDSTLVVDQVIDRRQFGNISPEELSTSALDYISLPDRLMHFNGVLRGFEITNAVNEYITISGGLALVDGNFEALNDQIITIPKVNELYSATNYSINFALCVNSEGDLVALPLTDFDAVLGTPNVPERLVVLFNVVSSTTYNTDANTFSYILNNRKDLTPLYIVSSTVTGAGSGATVALTYRDVRRFVNDSDSNIPAVLTNDNSQGNFHDLSAALTWLHFNNAFQEQLQVKGTHTIAVDPGFNGIAGLQVTGNGVGATLNFNTPCYLSGVTFSNLTINVNATLNANNNILFTGPVVFDNCTIQVNIANGFSIGNYMTFNNCAVTYNYNAALDIDFISTDLVNSFTGMMWANIGSGAGLFNFVLTNNTFTTPFAAHFAILSVQFSWYNAIAENITIANNSFISQTTEDVRAVLAFTSTLTTLAGAGYPLHPKVVDLVIENNICNQDQMIVITGTPDSTTGFMLGASLTCVHSRISHNLCGTIGFFTSANDTANFPNSGNGVVVRDKNDNLTISNNTCHFIACLNSTGTYIPFFFNQSTEFFVILRQSVQVPTGKVNIEGNTTNWINVGSYSTPAQPGNGPNILNNKLSPINAAYMGNYANSFLGIDPSSSTSSNPNGIYGINLLPDANNVGNSQSLIMGNILTQTPTYNTGGTSSDGYYLDGGISVNNNAQVFNNNINGVCSNIFSGFGTTLIQVGFNNATALVSNNSLNRNGLTIGAYVAGSSNTATQSLVVTDNFFDSVYTDAANTIFNDVFALATFSTTNTYIRNINQISYVAIPLYEYFSGGGSPPGASPPFVGAPNAGSPVNGSLQTSWQTAGSSGSFSWVLDGRIGDMLPAGVKLLYATVGIYNYVNQLGFLTTAAGSSIQVNLNVNMNNRVATPALPGAPATPISFPALSGSIADVAGVPSSLIYTFAPNSALLSLANPANLASLQNGTVFFLLDLSASAQPVFTGREYETVISIIMTNITWAGGQADIDLSPLVLRYAWM